MSKSEVERFARDLASKPALLAEVVAIAMRHGYGITVEDAKSLSDSQLDTLAGGLRLAEFGSPKTTEEVARALPDAALERVSAGESAQEAYDAAAKLAEAELRMRGGKQ